MDASPDSDEDLVRRLRRGELVAFDALYDRYERRLHGYVRRMSGADRVDDLFQDILLTVLRDRTYDPAKGRFAAWLFMVARNRCLAEQRRETSREALRDQARVHLEPAAPPAPDADSTRVHAAIAALPEPQRQLLLLKQVGELTYREIAELLGVAEGTIKSRLHAATVAFRRALTEGSGS